MKLNNLLRFPHPVLSPDSGDYLEGQLATSLSIYEDAEAGYLRVEGQLEITHREIHSLVNSGEVGAWLLICCLDTYSITQHSIALGNFTVELTAGNYRGAITFRVVLGIVAQEVNIPLGSLHPEFLVEANSRLKPGDVIGLGEEFEYEAGLEKLAPLESVFQLVKSTGIDEPRFELDTDNQAVLIAVPPALYDEISTLRAGPAKNALLSALYLPCLVELLSIAKEPKPELRWYQAIESRCRQLGLPLDGKDLAKRAQLLLVNPLGSLYTSIEGAH